MIPYLLRKNDYSIIIITIIMIISICIRFYWFSQKEGMLPLDKGAMAKLVEYTSKLADDKLKLSTRFNEILGEIRRNYCP